MTNPTDNLAIVIDATRLASEVAVAYANRDRLREELAANAIALEKANQEFDKFLDGKSALAGMSKSALKHQAMTAANFALGVKPKTKAVAKTPKLDADGNPVRRGRKPKNAPDAAAPTAQGEAAGNTPTPQAPEAHGEPGNGPADGMDKLVAVATAPGNGAGGDDDPLGNFGSNRAA
ncbi:MAG: hypothetical protein ING19_19205 [Azospirillum sp.]|nr:hypothetical protein [Azospirillum sp.]